MTEGKKLEFPRESQWEKIIVIKKEEQARQYDVTY